MNKSELVDKMAKETGLTKKDTEKALAAFTTIVSKELAKSNDVQLIGLGTFTVAKRAAREGINPLTKEKRTKSNETIDQLYCGGCPHCGIDWMHKGKHSPV